MESGYSSTDWRQVLEEAIGRTGRHPAAWFFYEEREDLRVSATADEPCRPIATGQRGVRIRRGGRQLESFLADPTPEYVLEASAFLPGSRPSPPAPAFEPAVDATGPIRQIDDLRDRIDRLSSGSPGLGLAVEWVSFRQRVWIARADADVVDDERSGSRIRVVLEHVGERARQSTVEAVFRGGSIGPERLQGIAEEAVERLRRRVAAVAVRPGPTTLVFAPGVAGVMMHELVGHALEGDTVLRGASALSLAREAVAPARVTVVDDPRRGRGAWRVDDEGVIPRPVPLIERGRLASLLLDRTTAAARNGRSTGHGRRSSFRERCLPRMGCTFLKPGSDLPDEILADTTSGIYIRRMDAASTDTRSGVATLRVTDADTIEHGRLERPLRPFLIQVETRQALGSLDRVANDLAFDTCVGSCVRDGQPVVTSVGAPTCRIGVATAL